MGMMTKPDNVELQVWAEPEIRELDVRETFAFPGRGADVGGNVFIDSQLS